jgi:indole-3-glycerol phosphate synthase
MTDFLIEMARERRERVERDAAGVPLAEVRERAEDRSEEKRPLDAALRRAPADPIRVIAEVKQASPSAGLLRPTYDPVALAREYAACGADAISVLTEPSRFHGTMEHLARVREAVHLPVLLKDFIVHERQIYEGAAHGADAALLIVAMLSRGQLRDYAALALELGMTPLVEIHEARDVEAALASPGVIGVNNRDLRTLVMRRGHAEALLPLLPANRVRVAESGYRERSEIVALERAGADAVLVGETLLRAETVAAGYEALFGKKEDRR